MRKTKEKKLSARLEKETFENLDKLKKLLGFKNYSEALRFSVTRTLTEELKRK